MLEYIIISFYHFVKDNKLTMSSVSYNSYLQRLANRCLGCHAPNLVMPFYTQAHSSIRTCAALLCYDTTIS
jgi:hypothetical protein